MNINITDIACKTARSVDRYARKNAPAILTTVGIVGMVGTTVLVARATLKAKPAFEEAKVALHAIENREVDEEYTRKQQTTEYGTTIMKIAEEGVKLFGPSIVLGTASIFCVIAAHGMMQKRQAALVAAYATLDQGFRAYRERVREELGEERELDFYRGVRGRTKQDLEEGEPCIITDYGDDPRIPSPYARFFDDTSANWSKTPEYNLMFLMSQQKYANDRLRAHGFVFLNEVYESLGLPRSQAGQMVGWKLREEGDPRGDGFVSFGLHDITDECNRAFINGLEHTVLLDFNVDGVIEI